MDVASDDEPMAATRQLLSVRQRRTVTALLDACDAEVREHGYDQMTVRGVAIRAGVTHTTAYVYFSSKAHLAAEAHLRQIRDLPSPVTTTTDPFEERVVAAIRDPVELSAADPNLAIAATQSMLSTEAEVQRLRMAAGVALVQRMETALGRDATPDVLDSLLMTYIGAMLSAGMGAFDYDGVLGRMRSAGRLLAPSRRGAVRGRRQPRRVETRGKSA